MSSLPHDAMNIQHADEASTTPIDGGGHRPADYDAPNSRLAGIYPE
jgi:hypothetical protein